MKRSRIARWVISASIAAATVGCDKPEERAEPAAATPAQAVDRVVQVDPSLVSDGLISLGSVERRNPEDELRATGQVEADLDGAADVGALVLSTVTRVLVREGDQVKRGQLLAELNAPDAARVAGELSRARSQRSRAESALARERKLIAQRATTQQELERAEGELKGLKADERAARMLLSAYGARGARVQIRAPIAGTLTHRGAEIGTRVDVGERLFRIVDMTKLLVRAEVLERDAHRVKSGDLARLIFPGGKICEAEVLARGAEVEPLRHTVSVRILPKHCALAIAGQTLDVRILTQTKSKSTFFALPRDALVELDGAPVVFTEGSKPGEFSVTSVTVERLTETTAFLSGGVSADRRVVISGTILLKGEWMRASME